MLNFLFKKLSFFENCMMSMRVKDGVTYKYMNSNILASLRDFIKLRVTVLSMVQKEFKKEKHINRLNETLDQWERKNKEFIVNKVTGSRVFSFSYFTRLKENNREVEK